MDFPEVFSSWHTQHFLLKTNDDTFDLLPNNQLDWFYKITRDTHDRKCWNVREYSYDSFSTMTHEHYYKYTHNGTDWCPKDTSVP